MTNLKHKIGARIRELRKRKGYTQYELAELVCLDTRSISRIEVGGNYPSFDSLEKICAVLDCPLPQFFEFNENIAESKRTLINIILQTDDKEIKNFIKMLEKFFKNN